MKEVCKAEPPIKAAVLMTCHNRREKTLCCLESLFACRNEEVFFDVYLVDDGSNDGTSAAVREKYKSVTLIEGDGSLFWNGGMSLAWRKASEAGDYNHYIWLNDDVVLFENALSELLRGVETYPDSIICGATIDGIDRTTSYGAYTESGQLLEPNGGFQEVDKGAINGNIVLVSRSVFKKIGMLDSFFTHALGDYEYAHRAHRNGVGIYLAPSSLGECDKGTRSQKWLDAKVGLISRFRHLYAPLGDNPNEYFYYEARYFGLRKAIYHYFVAHVRAMFPGVFQAGIAILSKGARNG